MRIHFYMPENCLPPVEERQDWLSRTPPRLLQSGKAASVQCWIYLTFLRLAGEGAPVELCHTIPDKGIVVALTGNLMPDFRAPDGVYLIGVVADGIPHPACHFHILQNAAHADRLPFSIYIPHWPQPGLVPRDRERADRFENIFFYGDPPNLAPELRYRSFAGLLKSRFGLNFQMIESNRWHDYSEADCILAIREFGSKKFLRKPSTKLYNAWMAGVPVIGGREAAFLADGRPDIDHVSCKSQDDVLHAIARLRDAPEFRRKIVTEGSRAARQFSPEIITDRWIKFLNFIATTHAPAHLAKSKLLSTPIRWKHRLLVAADRLRGGY